MDHLLDLIGEGAYHEAVGTLYDTVDAAMHAGHEAQSWPDIEALLNDPRWEKMPLELLIGALIITLPVKGRIGNARHHIIGLIKALDIPETHDSRLLVGLEEP
jgi:hypothetical protein